MSVQVISGSDTGLSETLLQQLGVRVISDYIVYRGRSYPEFGFDRQKFLAWLEEGGEITSAHPTVQDLITTFTQAGKDGTPILYIPISSRMSKAYELALSVRERLPDLRIEVFDPKRVMGGHALITLEAARLAKAGQSIEEILSALTRIDACIDEIIVADSLRQVAREGRVRNPEAAISSIIAVRPLLAFREGMPTPIGKARTNQQALDQIIAEIKKSLAQCEGTGLRAVVEYGMDDGWAEQVIDRLNREFSPRETWKFAASPLAILRVGKHAWSVAWKVER